jgi:predicted ATPase
MNDLSGSQWRKWDLHFHTPRSHDYQNKGLTPADLVAVLIAKQIEAVVVTDHHKLEPDFIEEMRKSAAGKLNVIAGIELSSNLGGDEGVHFIAIFPETLRLDYLSNELMSKLNLAQQRSRGIPENKLYVDFPGAEAVIHELGGLITIHGHGKAANFETITSHLKFKQQQKTDLLRDTVDLIEVGHPDHVDTYRNKIFPSINLERPLIICSDNHNATAYAPEHACWIRADPTFDGLRMALRYPAHRFCISNKPPSEDRCTSNKTKYITSVAFQRLPTMPSTEVWLQGRVPLNTGLVAIIGNKGSGKSALADSIGLLGSCSTSDAFSFLDPERFKNSKTGRASHVNASLTWLDGTTVTRRLDESVKSDEPERVKYLPQSFVEKVCNDLSSPGGGGFEQELKKVIFSKVSVPSRLGKRTLDELVAFKTQELRAAADSTAGELDALCQRRAALEERMDPSVRSSIEKLIAKRQDEIKSHNAVKPAVVQKPADDPTSAEGVAEIGRLKAERDKLSKLISEAETKVATQRLRAATGKKLIDKLSNLTSEIDRRCIDMQSEVQALGLDLTRLITFTTDVSDIERVISDATTIATQTMLTLDASAPDSLPARQNALAKDIEVRQKALDKPNQDYQEYLENHKKWQLSADALIGNNGMPDSLRGLEKELAELDSVPGNIAQIDLEQFALAKRIHDSRLAEAAVFMELYRPVQEFVDRHRLAKDHLKLEFRVDIFEDGFANAFIGLINQQRVGSFSGSDVGRARLQGLISSVDWKQWSSVEGFIRGVLEHLYRDKRPGYGGPSILKNQLRKGASASEVFSILFRLNSIRPRYVLRWEGKDVKQLSPGERGTLLLIFYLLIDDSDIPLVIDQPEANLDNLTVAMKLVHCIRDARERRQVIIVTHNPNLAVVCDADQIIHATIDQTNGSMISYTSGALESPQMNRFAIDVLEGSRGPFNIRDDTYRVMGE